MGRITIFTAHDLSSAWLKLELDHRRLPYSEINVAEHPDRLMDLMTLCSTHAVPQVWFNNRHVGNVLDTIRLLTTKWDISTRFDTPWKRYQFEIASQPDPISPHLVLSAETSNDNDKYDPERVEQELEESIMQGRQKWKLLPRRIQPACTILDMTERLQQALPAEPRLYKGTVYPRAFSGCEAVQVFQEKLHLTEIEAIQFGVVLQDARLLDHVADFNYTSGQFRNSDNEIYRLQCFRHSHILNSYRVWTEPHSYFGTPLELIAHLDWRLHQLERSSLDRTTGKVRYSVLSSSPRWPQLQEATCELQRISMKTMDYSERLVFGINVFRFMLRYARVKVGVAPPDQFSRYFRDVQFNVGGNLYSLREWMDGLLRSNKKSVFSETIPLGRLDARRKYTLPKLDKRIHFALFAGTHHFGRLPFRQFRVQSLEDELKMAAQILVADPLHVTLDLDSAKRTIQLSQWLEWYQKDLAKSPQALLEVLEQQVIDQYARLEWQACVWDPQGTQIQYQSQWWQPQHTEKKDAVGEEGPVYTPPHHQQQGTSALDLEREHLPPTNPENERIRIATLRNLNVLDTPPEDRYDRITAEMRDYFDVPVVWISLVEENRQWFKSIQWKCSTPAPQELPRDLSYCGHLINNTEEDIMIILNAENDSRFVHNPLLNGPEALKFYVGYALSVPAIDGGPHVKVGTLCILNHEPGQRLTMEDNERLRGYGSRVVQELLQSSTLIKVPNNSPQLRFQPAVEPEMERIRLRTVRQLNLLDTPAEARFDNITAQVQQYFDAPVVFVTMLDEDRNWFKSVQWNMPFPQPPESPRSISFCGHAINNGENDILVTNCLEDDRFADNPLVTGPTAVRFYAGYVLTVPSADGGPRVPVGTLCIIDQKARGELSAAQVDTLRTFGQQVETELARNVSSTPTITPFFDEGGE